MQEILLTLSKTLLLLSPILLFLAYRVFKKMEGLERKIKEEQCVDKWAQWFTSK